MIRMFEGNFFKIPLTQGLEAIVDPEDYARLSIHKWFALKIVLPSGRKYARAGRWLRRGKLLYMQYEILKVEPAKGLEIDHIDGNALNNTKNNLRVVTKMENMRNREGFGKRNFKELSRPDFRRYRLRKR